MEPLLEILGVRKQFGGLAALAGLDMHVNAGEIAERDRSQRRGQEHALQRHHRPLRARRRRHHVPRREHHRAAAPSGREARHRADVPERAPVPEHDRARERDGGPALPVEVRRRSARSCGLPATHREEERDPRTRAGGAGLLRHAALRATARSSRRSRCRTRTAAGSRWRARWRPSPCSCCSTSRRPG